MLPINNSDTAWLIVADYNQENGKYHEELREDILNPEIDTFIWEHNLHGVGAGSGKVGGWATMSFYVGHGNPSSSHGRVVGEEYSDCVGTHRI